MAALFTALVTCSGTPAPSLQAVSPERLMVASNVPLWGRFETAVTNGGSYTNPFTAVTLHATFSRPDGSTVPFWGFHDGDGNGGQTGQVWKLRFMPDQLGTWRFERSFSDGRPGSAGRFRCEGKGVRPGPLGVDAANPRYWIFADGTRYWPRAYSAPELFVAGNQRHRRFWMDYFFGHWVLCLKSQPQCAARTSIIVGTGNVPVVKRADDGREDLRFTAVGDHTCIVAITNHSPGRSRA